MRLENPQWLWLVPALFAAAGLLVAWWYRRRLVAARAFGSVGLLQRLTALPLEGFPRRRFWLVASAAAWIGVAIAGPQWGARIVESRSRGLDVVLALDVSASMLAADVLPNRLERMRTEASRLLRELAGDRVGLVIFAGRAYVLSPLTSDDAALEIFLDALDPEVGGTPGSSLAAALHQGTSLLSATRSGADRVLVVLSDGEAHESVDAIVAEARRAADAGVRVYGVGVGTERGEPIPVYDAERGRVVGYKRDAQGEVVLSKLGTETLTAMASTAGGAFVRADEGGVARLVSALEGLKRAEGAGVRRLEWTPRYHWFALLAFLMLSADALLAHPRRRR
jgi:Ca-activated chloride channel family protein